MFKIKKKQLRKIKNLLKTIPRIIGKRAFLTSLALFLVAIILGGLVFYEYIILAEQKKSEITQKVIYFDEKGLQEILNIWQERQSKFDQADFKQYLNPFKITQ